MLRACTKCGRLSPESRCAEHRPKPRRGSTRAWRKVRAKVLERDGYICNYCGDVEANEVDHVIPVDEGGNDDETNLVAACGFCNRSKHAGSVPGHKPAHLRRRGGR